MQLPIDFVTSLALSSHQTGTYQGIKRVISTAVCALFLCSQVYVVPS